MTSLKIEIIYCFFLLTNDHSSTKMITHLFDIPELTYMIVNLLDIKSIGRMVQVNQNF